MSLRSTLPIPTLNRLQALVWGGRVENFTFEAGKHIHHVRFMTADGCAKYFEDTENGINVPGEDTVVFVDRLPGSSSVNDLLHRIIDGGATRVIRVLDMGSEWTSEQLLSIARAKGRVVDKVVKGTAANNVGNGGLNTIQMLTRATASLCRVSVRQCLPCHQLQARPRRGRRV